MFLILWYIYIIIRTDEELAARRAAWQPPAPKYTTGVLSRYARLVTSADKGAYLS